jgi:hypothetical protein
MTIYNEEGCMIYAINLVMDKIWAKSRPLKSLMCIN